MNPVITTAGAAAAVSASGGGLSLRLTHIALGAASYAPTGAETTMVDRREKAVLVAGGLSAGVLTMVALVKSTAYGGATYNIGEVGFWAGDPDAGGTLFAVASAAGTNFGPRASNNGVDFLATFTMTLTGVPAGSVNITVDPNSSAAYLIVTGHESASNPHQQYLLRAGGTMTGPLTLAGNAVNPLEPTPLQQVQALFNSLFPIGAVMGFYRASAPAGWLAFGTAGLSRTTYAELYAAMVAANGAIAASGDGSSTFDIPPNPDFWRNVGVGRSVGSVQDWATGRPRNTTLQQVDEAGGLRALRGANDSLLIGANPSQAGFMRVSKTGNSVTTTGVDNQGAGTEADVVNVVDGDPETRPKNMALLFCIRAS